MSSTIQHRYNLRSTARRAMNQPVEKVKKEPIIKISIFMYLLNMIAYFLDACTPKVYKNMFKSQSEQDTLNRQQEQEEEEEEAQEQELEQQQINQIENQESTQEKEILNPPKTGPSIFFGNVTGPQLVFEDSEEKLRTGTYKARTYEDYLRGEELDKDEIICGFCGLNDDNSTEHERIGLCERCYDRS